MPTANVFALLSEHDKIRMRGREPIQTLGKDIVSGIYELLHGDSPKTDDLGPGVPREAADLPCEARDHLIKSTVLSRIAKIGNRYGDDARAQGGVTAIASRPGA